MRPSTDQYLSNRRKMEAYIAKLLPEDGLQVVLADGEDGEVWAELDPVRYEDGEWDLHWKTNCPEAIGLPEIYDHFRRHEMPVEERRREIIGCSEKVVPQKTKPESPRQLSGEFSQVFLLLEKVVDRISSLEKMVALARVKETYTAEEVAAQVRKSGWVVRQWCNKGQVPGAYKIQTGRGKKGEWRIPHEAVVRLQNEGPLPLDE